MSRLDFLYMRQWYYFGVTMASEKMLTKNFSVDELTCKCGCGACAMNADFMVKLQKVRDQVGRMIIDSGFRCETWNAKVGGANHSYHKVGRAADIFCVNEIWRFKLIEAAFTAGMRGIGVASNFVHLDDRDVEPWFHRYS